MIGELLVPYRVTHRADVQGKDRFLQIWWIVLIRPHPPLVAAEYTLLDSQFITGHLERFGAIEVPRADYRLLLADALKIGTGFHSNPGQDDLAEVMGREKPLHLRG